VPSELLTSSICLCARLLDVVDVFVFVGVCFANKFVFDVAAALAADAGRTPNRLAEVSADVDELVADCGIRSILVAKSVRLVAGAGVTDFARGCISAPAICGNVLMMFFALIYLVLSQNH
jgi:hypothetical protein